MRGSFRLDVGRSDHLGPLLGFIGNQPAEVGRRASKHHAAQVGNLSLSWARQERRLVVLVGQKKAVAIAVRNVSGRRRWSKLGEWLRPRAPLSRQVGVLG